jgi:STE24 endopeptidase
VFTAPLFNKYAKLEDLAIRDPILSMAQANGISAKNVYVQDASRQSTRISAFVTRFLRTERIVLNDNLLNRCSFAEIESVMGHEMGHYVTHDIYKALTFFGIVVALGFALLRRVSEWALQTGGTSGGSTMWRCRFSPS